MRINHLSGISSVHRVLKNPIQKTNVSPDINTNKLAKSHYVAVLSFGSNTIKNVGQVASIAPEYQGILNGIYKKGGLSNVAGEAAVAFHDKGKLDIRTFVPYYSADNITGGVRVLRAKESKALKDIQKEIQDGKTFEELKDKIELITVPQNHELAENEEFIIQQPINSNAPLKNQIAELEPTSLTGEVKSLDANMTTMSTVPYRLFKVKGTGAKTQGKPATYLVHIKDAARFSVAYNSEGAYAGNVFDDAVYSKFTKATVDVIPKMNTEEFGNYNPGNFWLHDRQSFPSLLEISEKSAAGDEYWKGIKVHSTYHNLGRDYQGHYKSPLDFMEIIGSDRDLKELKKNPFDYHFVKKMTKKLEKQRNNGSGKFRPEDIFTKKEFERLRKIFNPLLGNFIDETGEYNLCEIPIQGVKKNPYNYSAGTVSIHYGKEITNPNTREAAYGISKHLASIPTTNIVNGSSGINLGLDKVGKIGSGTGLDMEGFTPLTKEITQDKEKLFIAKENNKKWFIDRLAEVLQKPEEEKLGILFSKKDIDNGACVVGNLSKFSEGDMLFIGWGRGDAQKGFPTTIESFLQYLKDESVPSEWKTHTKFVIGADPWPKGAEKESKHPDWIAIKDKIKQIQELENGKYSGNICYLNGRFSNRIVACANITHLTSRYEPDGITQKESCTGATPVISNNTGGAPNCIRALKKGQKVTNQNGWLTEHAFVSNPETLGLSPDLKGAALDNARVEVLGKENAQCIKEAFGLFTESPEEYKKMMMNALETKIDWHENAEINQGLCAMEKYKGVWGLTSANEEIKGFERYSGALENLKGTISKNIGFNGKTLGIAGAALAVGVAVTSIIAGSKNKSKIARLKQEMKKANTPPILMMTTPSLDAFVKSAKV